MASRCGWACTPGESAGWDGRESGEEGRGGYISLTYVAGKMKHITLRVSRLPDKSINMQQAGQQLTTHKEHPSAVDASKSFHTHEEQTRDEQRTNQPAAQMFGVACTSHCYIFEPQSPSFATISFVCIAFTDEQWFDQRKTHNTKHKSHRERRQLTLSDSSHALLVVDMVVRRPVGSYFITAGLLLP